MSGSHVLHVLDAAHIKPHAKGGEHAITNGILLRQDLHTLLDLGYMTVTPEYRVEVSQKIKEEFNNGKEYYAIHGSTLGLPDSPSFRPDPELLQWHNESVFLG
jgi:putative restriction endonuclease